MTIATTPNDDDSPFWIHVYIKILVEQRRKLIKALNVTGEPQAIIHTEFHVVVEKERIVITSTSRSEIRRDPK